MDVSAAQSGLALEGHTPAKVATKGGFALKGIQLLDAYGGGSHASGLCHQRLIRHCIHPYDPYDTAPAGQP